MRSAGFPNRAEPPNLTLDDGKRPDGVTLIPYAMGKPLVWDGTVWSTLCASHVRDTAARAGAAAEKAAAAKLRKYARFEWDYLLTPLTFESHGPTSAATAEFVESLAKQIGRARGYRRTESVFLQRLSLAIQRGNALSVLGSMGADEREDGPTVCPC